MCSYGLGAINSSSYPGVKAFKIVKYITLPLCRLIYLEIFMTPCQFSVGIHSCLHYSTNPRTQFISVVLKAPTTELSRPCKAVWIFSQIWRVTRESTWRRELRKLGCDWLKLIGCSKNSLSICELVVVDVDSVWIHVHSWDWQLWVVGQLAQLNGLLYSGDTLIRALTQWRYKSGLRTALLTHHASSDTRARSDWKQQQHSELASMRPLDNDWGRSKPLNVPPGAQNLCIHLRFTRLRMEEASVR